MVKHLAMSISKILKRTKVESFEDFESDVVTLGSIFGTRSLKLPKPIKHPCFIEVWTEPASCDAIRSTVVYE